MTVTEDRSVPGGALDGAPGGRRFTARAAAGVGALLGAAVFGLCVDVLTDDAYITLTYARQLGLHGHWGMVDGLTSNTATSPLSVLLLGGLTVLTRNALLSAGVLLAACFAAVGWWLHRIAERIGLGTVLLPVLGLLTLAVNPLLMSAIGLESQLAVTLLVGAGWATVTRRPVVLGVLAALLLLTRPDLGPAALVLVLVGAPGARLRAGAATVATALPWFVFSWWAFRSAVPDTVLLKGRETWSGWSFWDGLVMYGHSMPVAVWLSVLPAVAGLAGLVLGWWRSRLALLWAGAGAAHYATMSALAPAPYHWYETFWVSALALVGVLAVARLLHPSRRGVPAACALVAAVAVLGASAALDAAHGIPRSGMMPITSYNWATPAAYRSLAARLPAHATVTAPAEVGTLAYYCDCRVIDRFADRGRLGPALRLRLAEAGPVLRTLLRWNYARFHPPPPARADYRLLPGRSHAGDPGAVVLTAPGRKYGRVVTLDPVR